MKEKQMKTNPQILTEVFSPVFKVEYLSASAFVPYAQRDLQ